MPAEQKKPVVHLLWINSGLSCDGDSVALTAAMQPSIEDIVLGTLPGLPQVAVHWPLIEYGQGGEEFMEWFWTAEWVTRLAPKALAVLAVGTCATYGGIHAMAGNPTGAMGVPDLLGWDWKSKAGIPVVCVPGCPIHPDNPAETITYLLYQAAGSAPMIPLDKELRPLWLFGRTVHEGCDRAGYYEQGDFAHEYGSPKCIVKLGCWGPVVKCNVPKRGWIGGVGGCPNVGGICIGCTMPGFPDKFMPFMDEPPGAKMSTNTVRIWGSVLRSLRGFTNRTLNQEPKWRKPGRALTTGYQPKWGGPHSPFAEPAEVSSW